MRHRQAHHLPPSSLGQSTPAAYQTSPLQSHTFLGFVQTPHDARLVVEACVAGDLHAFNTAEVSTLAGIKVSEGVVLVFVDEKAEKRMIRWRDGIKWSPSRPQSSFLLYRQVEPATTPLPYPPAKELSTRFTNQSLRGNARFIPNGLAKRTIGPITGSNGHIYRVVSYFRPVDVERLYADARREVVEAATGMHVQRVPSSCVEFERFEEVILGMEDEARVQRRTEQQLMLGVEGNGALFQQARTSHHHSSGNSVSRDQDAAYHPYFPRSNTLPIPRRHHDHNLHFEHHENHRIATVPSFSPSPEESAYFNGDHADHPKGFHPMFQVPEDACLTTQCACGGLGVRKVRDYFWNDPGWMERVCLLAPLKRCE
ncbi:hypothetical protein HDU98_003672 [Podochytrium sp. JEL0797]|nr:hypothetical protein HDU98_003672 [Podochytrium sp. JEL0797]